MERGDWGGVGREGLAKGWRRVGRGLAKGWRRGGGFPWNLKFRNSRGTRLEDLDSMGHGFGVVKPPLCQGGQMLFHGLWFASPWSHKPMETRVCDSMDKAAKVDKTQLFSTIAGGWLRFKNAGNHQNAGKTSLKPHVVTPHLAASWPQPTQKNVYVEPPAFKEEGRSTRKGHDASKGYKGMSGL